MPTEPTAAGSVSMSDREREVDTAAVAATAVLLGAAVPAGTTELGIDIIKVDRIRASIARFGERFSKRVLTAHEQRYVRARPETFAGRWAAKEAVSKVLGLGVRGIGWRDIEIERLPTGQPAVRLHGRAAARAEQLGMDRIAVSITHESDYAVAIAFGVRTTGGRYVFPPDIEARLDDRERQLLARMDRLRELSAAAARLAEQAPAAPVSETPAISGDGPERSRG
jgi:holo-[acyl-carrier protein] synthase